MPQTNPLSDGGRRKSFVPNWGFQGAALGVHPTSRRVLRGWDIELQMQSPHHVRSSRSSACVCTFRSETPACKTSEELFLCTFCRPSNDEGQVSEGQALANVWKPTEARTTGKSLCYKRKIVPISAILESAANPPPNPLFSVVRPSIGLGQERQTMGLPRNFCFVQKFSGETLSKVQFPRGYDPDRLCP